MLQPSEEEITKDQQDKIEWVRLTTDIMDQKPLIAPEEWSRQVAIECIFARILLMLDKRGEHGVEELVLSIPPGWVSDSPAYVNVFERIRFILRNIRGQWP